MAGPSRPAPRVAAVPAAGRIPVTSDTAAAPATGPYPASSQEPTLIGELGLKTRRMFVEGQGPAPCRRARRRGGGAGQPAEEQVPGHVRPLPHRLLDHRTAVVGGELGIG